MMRALWTGATGMSAQQTNLDAISNNLANVNTVGYKKETVEFKSLLYSKLQTKTNDHEGNPKPVLGQVGGGVKVSAMVSRFTNGTPTQTDEPLDFAIVGDGFFRVVDRNGEEVYTRNGSFQFAIGQEGITLATSDGLPVLDRGGEMIVFDMNTTASLIEIDDEGRVWYPDEEGELQYTGYTIGLAQFNNPSGLEKLGGSLYRQSPNSGEVRYEGEDDGLKKSTLKSGYLEGSNVSVVDEMVNLIVAQRAYEMNSKIINASDEMLQQANNLRR